MRTAKEIEKDLYNVCNGAGYMTSPQLQRYMSWGKDKTNNFVKRNRIPYIGDTKARRYDLKSVALALSRSQQVPDVPDYFIVKQAKIRA